LQGETETPNKKRGNTRYFFYPTHLYAINVHLIIMNTVYVSDARLHRIFAITSDHLQFIKDAIDEKLEREELHGTRTI